MFLSSLVKVFTHLVIFSCFYFEVCCHPRVPVRFPACVNLFHLCLVVFPPSCLFKPRLLSCLGQITCHFCQCSSLLFFPEWFLTRCLFYSWDTREFPARLLYLCCVSWFPGFDFCFIEQLWSSLTHQLCLSVHSLVFKWHSFDTETQLGDLYGSMLILPCFICLLNCIQKNQFSLFNYVLSVTKKVGSRYFKSNSGKDQLFFRRKKKNIGPGSYGRGLLLMANG